MRHARRGSTGQNTATTIMRDAMPTLDVLRLPMPPIAMRRHLTRLSVTRFPPPYAAVATSHHRTPEYSTTQGQDSNQPQAPLRVLRTDHTNNSATNSRGSSAPSATHTPCQAHVPASRDVPSHPTPPGRAHHPHRPRQVPTMQLHGPAHGLLPAHASASSRPAAAFPGACCSTV